jgi:hypothetical protein
VPPLTVVKYLNVPEYVPAGFFMGFVFLVKEHLAFYGAEKGFGTGIIVTVAFTAHAAYHSMFLKKLLVILAAILYSSIRMVNQPF